MFHISVKGGYPFYLHCMVLFQAQRHTHMLPLLNPLIHALMSNENSLVHCHCNYGERESRLPATDILQHSSNHDFPVARITWLERVWASINVI